MEASKSGLFTKSLAAITALISAIIAGARLLAAAVDASVETLIALGLVDDKTSALVLFAACSIVLFLLGYCVSALCYKQPAAFHKKQEAKIGEVTHNMGLNTKKATNKQESSPPADIGTSSTKPIPTQSAPNMVYSENESDSSDRALSIPVIDLALRPNKHPDVHNDPDLVPE
jgi:hypothetical protein